MQGWQVHLFWHFVKWIIPTLKLRAGMNTEVDSRKTLSQVVCSKQERGMNAEHYCLYECLKKFLSMQDGL